MTKSFQNNDSFQNNPNLIARYVYYLAKKEDTFVGSTFLQKFFWFSQIVFYHREQKALFFGENEFEAWDYGPVIKEFWEDFATFGGNVIDPNSNDLFIRDSLKIWNKYQVGKYDSDFWNKLKEEKENAKFFKTFNDVWEAKKSKHGWALAKETHRHQPWIEVYTNGVTSDRLISNDLVKKYSSDIYTKDPDLAK